MVEYLLCKFSHGKKLSLVCQRVQLADNLLYVMLESYKNTVSLFFSYKYILATYDMYQRSHLFLY